MRIGSFTAEVVKVCGLTNPEDALAAATAGADVLGFVFFPHSRRSLSPAAASWIAQLPPRPAKAGVFRDQDPSFVAEVVGIARLDLVQLHGEESPEVCAQLGGRQAVIKAVSVAGPLDWGRVRAYAEVAQVLFDTASATGGGTGRTFDWSLLAGRPPDVPFWIAGGLNPTNVAAAINATSPDGVDVASGVELAMGRKDPDRMRAFVSAARAAWAGLGEKGRRDETAAR